MVLFYFVVQDGWPALTASITSTTLQGLLAQRLAQGTHNPWVLGSNPGGPTTTTSGFSDIQSIGETAFVLAFPSRILVFLLAIHNYPQLICA